jgi:hypothetical protein
MNLQQSERLIDDIRRFYISEINKSALKHGGFESLSESIGLSKSGISQVLHRGSFSALRRVVKKIYEAKK